MTRTRTSTSFVTLLLVAGLAAGLLVAGIVRRADADQPSGNRKAVKVPLLMTNGEVSGVGQPVSDDTKSNGKEVGLSKKLGHHAEWVTSPPSADVEMTIGMKVDNPYPFDGAFRNDGNSVTSAKLLKDAREGTYEYWINVHDKKTGKDFRLDPPIRVDP